MLERYAKAILEVSEVVTVANDLQGLVELLHDILARYLNFDWLALFTILKYETRINVTTRLDIGFNWDELYQDIAPFDELGRAAVSGQPGQFLFSQVVFNPRRDHDVFVMDYIRHKCDTCHCMVMPLRVDAANIFTLGLYRSQGQPFGQAEQTFMQHILPLIYSKFKTMALLREIDLRTAICELSEPQSCSMLLDERFKVADLPDNTRRMLERFYGGPVGDLPPAIATWLRSCVACQGRLVMLGGPWKLQQVSPVGRLECQACILPAGGSKRLLLLQFALHGRKDDFSALARIGLSRRELEVLSFLPLGYSNIQIASALEIGEVTVKKHLRNAGDKLGVSGKTGILYAAMHRLREIETRFE